jgi:UPF0271 protein
MRVDLNADLGEGCATDAELLALVTSANVACGAHAGDVETMRRTIVRAKETGAAVGAHPGYPDREGFGRRDRPMSGHEVERTVGEQVRGLAAIARAEGVRLQHVKAHGSLYNHAADDAGTADAIARAVAAHDAALVFFGLPGSELERAARAAGLRFAAEFFADRTYLDDGRLTPRARADAFVHDAGAAAERVLTMLREGRVRSVTGAWLAVRADTVCVHGDNPQAIAFATALRARLQDEGVSLLSLTA